LESFSHALGDLERKGERGASVKRERGKGGGEKPSSKIMNARKTEEEEKEVEDKDFYDGKTLPPIWREKNTFFIARKPSVR